MKWKSLGRQCIISDFLSKLGIFKTESAGASPEHREPEQELVLEIFEPISWFKYFTDSEGYVIGENPYWKGLKNDK